MKPERKIIRFEFMHGEWGMREPINERAFRKDFVLHSWGYNFAMPYRLLEWVKGWIGATP